MPVPYCPFCGSAQASRIAPWQEAAPVISPTAGFDRAAAPSPVPTPAPNENRVATAEPRRPWPVARQAPPRRRPARPSPPRCRTVRLRDIVLAALLIETLLRLASGQGTAQLPPPARLTVGTAWTPVALPRFRSAPLWRLTGDTAFSLRVDGERVLRVGQGEGISVGTRMLRSLELRAPRPSAVTLVPERD